jgi:hypothetical protein
MTTAFVRIASVDKRQHYRLKNGIQIPGPALWSTERPPTERPQKGKGSLEPFAIEGLDSQSAAISIDQLIRCGLASACRQFEPRFGTLEVT